MTLVLDRGGTSLDHIAIGVPDTRKGVARIAELTGYEPILQDPDPASFYWSGTLPMGQGQFLEILGPNPEFRGFNPFIEIVKRLDGPRPLFWYVATDDFERFCDVAKAAGGPVERISEFSGVFEGQPMDYIRGIIGPGFLSVCPNVIQWRARDESLIEGEGPEFRGIRLHHPEAARLNSVFDQIGINQRVETGSHRIELTIGTRKGDIVFAANGLELRGLSAMMTMAGYYIRWLLGGRR